MDAQRYAISLCLVYGSNPDRFRDLIDGELLDTERDLFCEYEYANKSISWARVLDTYSGR